MKPAPFRYFAPSSVEEALEILAAHPDARPLAGGQSLIPAMNFRLARPGALVDLGRISTLRGVEPTDEGGVVIGATTPQREIGRHPLVAERCPLMHEAIPWIGHEQIRTRGTIGGSLAHADPSAELPAVVLALGGALHLQGPRGRRTVRAAEFFLGPMSTALQPGELLLSVELPPGPRRGGHAFEEVSRRHGDYALAGVAVQVALAEDATTRDVRLVLLSVGDTPLLAETAAIALRGRRAVPGLIEQAAAAVAAELDPPGDIHASADYRRHLARVLARRGLTRAFDRARASA